MPEGRARGRRARRIRMGEWHAGEGAPHRPVNPLTSGSTDLSGAPGRTVARHTGRGGISPCIPRLTRCVPLASYAFHQCAGVAQLVRVPACHAGGRGFEPRHSRHSSRNGFRASRPDMGAETPDRHLLYPARQAPAERLCRALRPDGPPGMVLPVHLQHDRGVLGARHQVAMDRQQQAPEHGHRRDHPRHETAPAT